MVAGTKIRSSAKRFYGTMCAATALARPDRTPMADGICKYCYCSLQMDDIFNDAETSFHQL